MDKQKCCIPSFWDLTVETMLAEDRVALNLLYTQAIWEVERGWVLATKDIRNKLSSLQSRGEKKEVYCNQTRTC
jgi:sorting nexin-17